MAGCDHVLNKVASFVSNLNKKMNPLISVKNLSKYYRSIKAVDGVSFDKVRVRS